MPSKPPQAVKAPFEQKQQQTNTYAPQSIADTPEAQAFLDVPIDIDPGVGRRTDLAEQEVGQQYDSAFMSGVPGFLRNRMRESDLRKVRSQGAYEAQAANVEKNRLQLARRERLLPQVLPTGGSGTSSGFNTQIVQPQPGFLQKLALGAVGGASSAATALAGRPRG